MSKTTQANRLDEINREIELVTPEVIRFMSLEAELTTKGLTGAQLQLAVIRFMNLKAELTAKGLTGVQQQLADRAAIYCELVAERTRIEG